MKNLLLIILMAIPFASFSFGPVPQEISGDTLKVGVHVVPPFVTHEPMGNGYGGICIDLLSKHLKNSGINNVKYVDYAETNDLVDAVERGDVDLGIGSITINGSRYDKVDFTQPYFTSTVSIAYDKDKLSSSWSYISSFVNLNTLLGIIYLFVFFYFIGFLFWVIERNNSDFFRTDHWGVWDGFYYAVIVFTTIGFGDKVCKTKLGKVFTVFYGLVCLGIAGIFIGNISSSITLNKLESDISIETLNKRKVGTVKGSSVTDFLDNKGVRYIGYDNVEEGLQAIKNGELEVFVYDTPIMQYLIDKDNLSEVIALSEETYDPQYYGFAIPKGSDVSDKINPVIISYIKSSEWRNTLQFYNLSE